MKEPDILTSSSMPMASPSYPKGPYRFIDREFMIITYKSDPDAIRDALPEPLEPDGSDTVLYEFIKMPDSRFWRLHGKRGGHSGPLQE
jgi:acetoacetate decarboxylase